MGLRNWIGTFADPFLAVVPQEEREEVLTKVESKLRGHVYRDGAWYADYVRLRVVALRQDTSQ